MIQLYGRAEFDKLNKAYANYKYISSGSIYDPNNITYNKKEQEQIYWANVHSDKIDYHEVN